MVESIGRLAGARPHRVASRPALVASFCLAATLLGGDSASAQDPGETHVTFWRGDLRIIATEPDTSVTVLDLRTGLPMDPALWSGNIATNPVQLDNVGDSFEANSLGQTHRIRVIARPSRGPDVPKPIVVWTGWLAASLKHPLSPPADQNAWLSYIPDMVQPGATQGAEVGTSFLGFTSRDLWIIVQAGTDPVSVTIEDLATNTEADTDDSTTLDETSPELVHRDGEIAVFRMSTFEDDTIRVTTSAPATVLAGIASPAWPDWATTPPSYGPGESGRELGTLFYFFASRWVTILPVVDDTTITITDLTDGDDSDTFVLTNGSRAGADYDVYVSDPLGRSSQMAVPRASGPAVSFYFPPGGPIDDDILKVESDRPVLIQVGPIASDTNEFADVSYSVPTGPTSQLIHCYSQNGGAEDFQMFSESDTNNVVITSLTYTQGFGTMTHHDHQIPVPEPWTGGNAITGDWFWSSPTWAGELLRIETDVGVQVMAGDYDTANFGAFIPMVPDALTVPPRADAGPDVSVCPGTEVTLDGTDSFDGDFVPGMGTETWEWDLDADVDSGADGVPDNDVDATGPVVMATFPPGSTRVKLTFTDDDGESSIDFVVVNVEDVTPPVPSCSPLVWGTATSWDGGMASPMATATDDCDPDPDITNDRTAGGPDATDMYPCGASEVTFTATDESGNFASCTSIVIIVADAPPPPVGTALYVTKDATEAPVLDWSDAGAPGAQSRWAVLRATENAGRPFVSWRSPLDVTSVTDTAAVERLVFYDARRVVCDGSLSVD